MLYSGFADEAAPDLAGQIAATRALGWSDLELRNIDGSMCHEMAEADFDRAAGQLADAGISVRHTAPVIPMPCAASAMLSGLYSTRPFAPSATNHCHAPNRYSGWASAFVPAASVLVTGS